MGGREQKVSTRLPEFRENRKTMVHYLLHIHVYLTPEMKGQCTASLSLLQKVVLLKALDTY